MLTSHSSWEVSLEAGTLQELLHFALHCSFPHFSTWRSRSVGNTGGRTQSYTIEARNQLKMVVQINAVVSEFGGL